MRLHRFIGDFDLSRDVIDLTDPNLCNQIARVFRMKNGDACVLCDGRGNDARVSIVEIKKKTIRVRMEERMKSTPELSREISLCCAILKKENFELVVQKATEIGVARIVPLISERTVRQSVRNDRLAEIAREAAEQCGRGIVPEIGEKMTFKDALAYCGGNAYFFDMDGVRGDSVKFPHEDPMHLFIGPEGGWSDAERSDIQRAGYVIVSLSPFVFRAETAAIAATFLATQ